jgi:hypothetical protein
MNLRRKDSLRKTITRDADFPLAILQSVVSMPVAPALTIDPADGSVRIGGRTLLIGAGLAKAEAAAGLSQFYHSYKQLNNGYERLSFRGVEFGGRTASFALTFYLGKLIEISLWAMLPTEKLERVWPTREVIDEEVAFLLGHRLGRAYASGREQFPWGVSWAGFDGKAFTARAELHYEP